MEKNVLTSKPFQLLPILLASVAIANNSNNSVPADNSAINARDRNAEAVTPEDQVRGSKRDVELTQRVRKELMQRDDLSVYAQNVKIVTIGGVLTLRGPVKSEDEKNRVASAARKVVGASNVRNELEVDNQ